MRKDEALRREFQTRLAQAKFYQYRPFGHPDTLCPDGKVFKKLAWEAWTNKSWQLEFHNTQAKEKAAIAANGVGKSLCTTWETAAHLLGDYPKWFKGFKFDRPVHWWIGSIDADQQRIGIQNHLLGPDLDKNLGTGFIPKDRIIGKVKIRQAGISDVADKVVIRHATGGYSTLTFKTYTQGWKSWQGGKPDGITFDEEPDESDAKQKDVFTEMQTRIFRSGGLLLGGLTPLLGETTLTRHFMYPKADGIICVYATWDDAPHLKSEDKQRLILTFPDHVRESRTKGVPMMGEGKVFGISEEDIKCPIFQMPNHYARICGVDFGVGVGHPTAAAWLCWDRDRDIVYLYDEYRAEGETSVYHAEAIKRRGKWIPVSWPHDGHKTSDLTKSKADGESIKEKYAGHGLNMLPISARYDRDTGGSQPQEPIIDTLLERMRTGRFVAFETCVKFFEEVRSFHRKDGRIVNRREDLIKAVLYALMMLRYAHPQPALKRGTRSHFRPLRVQNA